MIEFKESDISYLAVELPDRVKFYKYSGDFEGEAAVIKEILEAGNLWNGLRKRLEIELVIADGMKSDYITSFGQLLASIREKYPNVKEEHLEAIIKLGNADFIMKNGERFFQNSARRNILKCNRDYLESTGKEGRASVPVPEFTNENIRKMRDKGWRSARIRIEEHLQFTPDIDSEIGLNPAGNARVHLPYPCVCPEQSDIILHSSSHPVHISGTGQRTAFINVPYVSGDRYSVEFSYTIKIPYFDPEPSLVKSDQPVFFTGEQYPHIRFTPAIRSLAEELKNGGADNLTLARRAYEWITKNVVYSYMRSYLYLDNIPEFCLLNRRGDCGVQALLFITLCRAMGVPARWQSGSRVEPGDIGSHDWAQFYAAPYGWMYCDPSYGGSAYRAGNRERWNYYACNLDIFREINATDFQAQFDPPKKYMRRDPYDNQSGEAELDAFGPDDGMVRTGRRVVSFDEID